MIGVLCVCVYVCGGVRFACQSSINDVVGMVNVHGTTRSSEFCFHGKIRINPRGTSLGIKSI